MTPLQYVLIAVVSCLGTCPAFRTECNCVCDRKDLCESVRSMKTAVDSNVDHLRQWTRHSNFVQRIHERWDDEVESVVRYHWEVRLNETRRLLNSCLESQKEAEKSIQKISLSMETLEKQVNDNLTARLRSVEIFLETFTKEFANVSKQHITDKKEDLLVPPTISTGSVETRTAPFGSTVVFDCKTTLDPPVANTWYKQDGVMPPGATQSNGQLTIPDVKGEDAGTYICTSKSPVGSTDITTTLIVTGVFHFSQAPLSYMRMPTLSEAYLYVEVEIAFKPESMSGLLLYNGQKQDQGDFISLVLNNGYVEFRFELGSGPAILRSTTPLEIGKWHVVKISRYIKNGVLIVDDQPEVTGSAQGNFLGLDLLEPMYIGSVPDFRLIESNAGATKGFIGCISHYKTDKVIHNLLREAETYGISTCETCAQCRS